MYYPPEILEMILKIKVNNFRRNVLNEMLYFRRNVDHVWFTESYNYKTRNSRHKLILLKDGGSFIVTHFV